MIQTPNPVSKAFVGEACLVTLREAFNFNKKQKLGGKWDK